MLVIFVEGALRLALALDREKSCWAVAGTTQGESILVHRAPLVFADAGEKGVGPSRGIRLAPGNTALRNSIRQIVPRPLAP